jgi:hypothetical protein
VRLAATLLYGLESEIDFARISGEMDAQVRVLDESRTILSITAMAK